MCTDVYKPFSLVKTYFSCFSSENHNRREIDYILLLSACKCTDKYNYSTYYNRCLVCIDCFQTNPEEVLSSNPALGISFTTLLRYSIDRTLQELLSGWVGNQTHFVVPRWSAAIGVVPIAHFHNDILKSALRVLHFHYYNTDFVVTRLSPLNLSPKFEKPSSGGTVFLPSALLFPPDTLH